MVSLDLKVLSGLCSLNKIRYLMFKDKVTKHSDTVGMYTVIVTRFCIQWGGCSQPKKTPQTPRTKVDIKSFATTIDIVELRIRG